MTSQSSDGFFIGYPSFTEEDLELIDAYQRNEDVQPLIVDNLEESFQSEIDGLKFKNLTEEDWTRLDNHVKDVEGAAVGEGSPRCLDASFASEIHHVGAVDFHILDTAVQDRLGEPLVPVGFEQEFEGPGLIEKSAPQAALASPLRSFRQTNVLSVTDLAGPTWCEVQFDYGLRGKRSRPIHTRPTSFKSSTGKVIFVEQRIAERNDIRTRQGLSIHKELQREIRTEELQVDITTKETLWALRIVNSLACLKELLHGPRHMTREMPVFGILHDQVVVGIIDEVEEVYRSVSSQSRHKTRLRSNGSTSGTPPLKRSVGRSGRMLPNSRENTNHSPESVEKPVRFLQVRDAKTRKNNWMPCEPDLLSGRLQLYMYRTLLFNLVSHDPPFNFDRLWTELGVDSDVKLPTTFLVQAKLIQPKEVGTVSLNDLASSFHQMVMSENIQVNRLLELVYYQCPTTADQRKGKGVGLPLEEVITQEFEAHHDETADLARAIAMSLESSVSNEFGPSHQATISAYGFVPASVVSGGSCIDEANELPENSISKPSAIEHHGIRGFPLIGRHTFFYDPDERNLHVSRVLEWWRGERQPEGVPIELAYRCRSCEYANDCEWRIAKASESSKR